MDAIQSVAVSVKEQRWNQEERAANKYKQVEYMQGFLGQDFGRRDQWGGPPFGFWVETVELN